MRRLVFLGPPGAGKGTQAQRIARKLGVPHLATGDILREEVRRDSELGRRARAHMERGGLVPDALMIELIRGRLEGLEGFVLDGFPRTVEQAQALSGITALDRVVELQVSQEALVERLSARRVCESCGQVYNLDSRPPSRAGYCDACGGPLLQRRDDRPEVIRERYRVYQAQSAPLSEYYRQQGLLARVDGERPLDEVTQAIESALCCA